MADWKMEGDGTTCGSGEAELSKRGSKLSEKATPSLAPLGV